MAPEHTLRNDERPRLTTRTAPRLRFANVRPAVARRFSRRRILIGALALGGAVTLAACGEATGSSAATTSSGGSDVTSFPRGDTRAAPDFMLMAYQGADELGGDEVAFSQILSDGKPVILNFWAGQCPPCRVEMPDLQAFYEKNRDRVTLIGLDVGPFVGLGSVADGKALARELGVTYPLGTTSDQSIVQNYRVLGMPTSVFITSDGQIIRQWTGLLNEESLTGLAEELLQASQV